MNLIYGTYFVKLHPDYGFCMPGNIHSRYNFWTNHITYEDDGSVTFEPLNTDACAEWPITINVHMSNCVIFRMRKSS